MRKLLQSLLKKKRSGDAELIVSIFVIGSLSVVLLLFVSLIGDLNVRMDLRQQVRKCALQAESADLSTNEKITKLEQDTENSIRTSLGSNVVSVTVSIGTGTSKDASGVVSAQKPNGGCFKYGDSIVVLVKCTVKTTGYDATAGGFGKMGKTKSTNYIIQKATTCKRLE